MTEKISLKDAKRARIIEVAGEMFVAHGYKDTSMEAIAEAAPVSKPTLYNHFKDKAALYTAVMMERSHALFDQLAEEIRQDSTPEDTLRRLGNKFLEIVTRPQAISMYRIMIGESQHFPELGEMFFQNGPKRIGALLEDYLKSLHDKGILDVPHPDMSAGFFLNMVKSNPHMQCLLGFKKTIPPKERAATVDYAVYVFLNGHRR